MSQLQNYSHNKIRTLTQIVQRIENWPTAVGLRLFRRRRGLRLLAFRDGLNVICRGGTRDWDVIHELLFAGSYQRALQYLRAQPGAPLVVDLGGNIGLFSLLAASAHPQARVIAFEPGPPNQAIFEMNREANSGFAGRIELRREAVGGATRTAAWTFDEQNPGGSGLYSSDGPQHQVEIVSFAELVHSLKSPITLLKIDIEGAEYELAAAASAEIWKQVRAISLELHDDPENRITQQAFLDRIKGQGFNIEQESVCSYFLTSTAAQQKTIGRSSTSA